MRTQLSRFGLFDFLIEDLCAGWAPISTVLDSINTEGSCFSGKELTELPNILILLLFDMYLGNLDGQFLAVDRVILRIAPRPGLLEAS